jgi:hypothetical protein
MQGIVIRASRRLIPRLAMTLKKLNNVTYSEGIQQVPEYLRLAEQATAYLDDLLQDSAPRIPGKWPTRRVLAEWDRLEEGAGRSVLTLHIWDDHAEGRARFTPDELRTLPIRDHRLWRVWDDLLREDIEKRLHALLEDGDAAED